MVFSVKRFMSNGHEPLYFSEYMNFKAKPYLSRIKTENPAAKKFDIRSKKKITNISGT